MKSLNLSRKRMTVEEHRKFIQNYDYSSLDAEYGFQERVSPITLDLALYLLERLGVEDCSVAPYEGGIDLFWGNRNVGHLLIHVYEGEWSVSGLGSKSPDIEISKGTEESIPLIKKWLQSR